MLYLGLYILRGNLLRRLFFRTLGKVLKSFRFPTFSWLSLDLYILRITFPDESSCFSPRSSAVSRSPFYRVIPGQIYHYNAPSSIHAKWIPRYSIVRRFLILKDKLQKFSLFGLLTKKEFIFLFNVGFF